ncbi:response regulator [Paenibacillus piri]|uniref:Response regulator n=1 Tax=Paenibacillus piri TaxID=2547395 RepID=A0A4R5KSK2_9BACL|nr:response regulator [Paenibacillus piri]TDF98843.1 response regulator [Paenibacillus piri]
MNQQIRLIIVDDEPLVRERFKYGFALQENGYVIAGEAEDGEEALQLCEQLQTDIVITDIVMPRMDGLELTRRLKEKHPAIKVIILSNYQEFEFARKAVALGALGYMLKVTSGNEELLSLLAQARKEIEEERSRMMEQISVRQLLHKQLPVLRKQFVLDVLNHTYAGEQELFKQLADLKLHLPSGGLSAAALHIDDYSGLRQTYPARDVALFKYVLIRIAEELSFPYCKCNILAWNDRELLLLLHWNEDSVQQDGQYERFVQTVFAKLTGAVSQYLPFTFSLGISCMKPRSSGQSASMFLQHSLKEALREAELAAKRRFYSGNGSFSIYKPDDRYAAMDKESVQQLNNALEYINGCADQGEIKQEIHDLLISRLEEARFQPEQVTAWLEQAVDHFYLPGQAVHKHISEKLDTVEALHDVGPFLQLLIQSRQTELPLPHPNDPNVHYREVVEKALQYITAHYHMPVSITDICQQVNVTPNYFSMIFKKETGINYTDYLTNFRMMQAKRLLSETSLLVQEVAEKIGIPDYNYFTRLFRRTVGCSPSAYRKEF